ncbi:hypothetical protein [Tenggerimyces flavus]|uniref:Lipoprotein n=1 Tax=Tenggerimyces flavus TaxID=1708749 RepID=A0ABV7YK27_9ACTN|nr:hypothetical protein [Tenggerimyces flavus]MBM7787568.1 hypothetical protein [Tenggerimyces flavus]
MSPARWRGGCLLAALAFAVSCSPGIVVEQAEGGRLGGDWRPAAWITDDGHLAVVVAGSSGCPTEPVEVEPLDPHHLVVTVRPDEPSNGAVCTADLVPTTSVIRLPAEISAPPLTVDFRGKGHGVPHSVTLR